MLIFKINICRNLYVWLKFFKLLITFSLYQIFNFLSQLKRFKNVDKFKVFD